MSTSPDISVVMSVYNGARYLQCGLESILDQQDVNFEFIVINDGSTDESGQILARYAAMDSRLQVVEQENAGLTRSLIRGCSIARGRFIARQDSDDISMPGRLKRQSDLLDQIPGVDLVSAWAEVIGPCDEPLLTYKRPADPEQATELMMHGRVGPPGHGSVMFRRGAYEKAGGYRALFYYAQDSDLWLRMGMSGKIAYIQDVLYRYRISAESISGRLHPAKLPYARLISELHEARLMGQGEESIIARANLGPVQDSASVRANSEDATLYFIARCLFDRRDSRARKYLRQCINKNPRNLRAWCLLPFTEVLALIDRREHAA